MAVKTFNTRIKLKYDQNSNWKPADGTGLVLLQGEFGYDSTKKNFFIGDGTTASKNLKYVIGESIMADYVAAPTGITLTDSIADTDSLNIALAKLQKQVTEAAASAGVTNVTVDGASVVPQNSTVAALSTDSNSPYNASNNVLATIGTVDAAIDALDVAAITGTAGQTITSISETNGKITATYSNISITSSQISDLANTYSSTGTVAITGTGVAAALATLDASTVATAVTANAANGTGTTVTIKGVKEDDGIISQGEGTNTFTIGDGALKLSGYGATSNDSIPTVAATDVFSANDTDDSTIALGNGFVLDATNKTIGIRTNQAVAANNNIATMNDIASLSGAMHYGGAMASDSDWPSSTTPGDTWIVETGFTHGTTALEAGDMVVFGENGSYNVVQSNMTLGVGQGQVAANSAALTSGKIVVASGTGIETSLYAVTDIASEAVGVSASNGTVTVSDTLTVGGTAQQAQSFTITGANGITASASGNAITVSHSTTTAASAAAVKVGNDQYGHVVLGSALESTDIAHSATIGTTAVTTVSGALGALETLAEGAVQEVKTLKTSDTAQSKVPSGEAIEGSGDIVLHDIAKTGNTDDLIQGLTILFDCGTATTITDTPANS